MNHAKNLWNNSAALVSLCKCWKLSSGVSEGPPGSPELWIVTIRDVRSTFRQTTGSTRFEGTVNTRLSPLRHNNVFSLKFNRGFCTRQSQWEFCWWNHAYVKILLKRQLFWGFVFLKCKTKRPSFLQSNNMSENRRLITKDLYQKSVKGKANKRL